MINEDKVKMMAKIQLFDDKEKDAMRINNWYQIDFLGVYLIRSLIAYLVLVFIMLLTVIALQWETILTSMDVMVLWENARMLFFGCLLLLIPCMIISYIVCWFRYRYARKRIREHVADLKRLNAWYDDTDS